MPAPTGRLFLATPLYAPRVPGGAGFAGGREGRAGAPFQMKKFKFTLAPVLEHRERIEEEKQQVLAARLAELAAAQNELARLNGEFKRYSTSLRDGHKTLTSQQLRAHYAHLEFLD